MSTKKVKAVPNAVSGGSPGTEFAYRRVWEINQLLVPKPHDFISTSRFFVKEGLLVMWDDHKRCKVKRYCFLFNDLFLFTIPKKKGKKFQLLVYMVLRTPSVSVELVDNSSYNAEFRLHARRKSFIFFSETMEDRKYWVKALEASIKGTHPEEQHTRAVHQQAKEIAKAPIVEAAAGNHHHNDDDAEMTIYSSGSGDGSDEESPPPAPVSSKPKKQQATSAQPAAPATIDFSTANPFASNVAPSPFASSPNPFMTGVTRATVLPTTTPPTTFSAPFATTPVVVPGATMTNNPFLTTPAAGGQISSTTTTFTQVVTTGAPNPFTTNNPFATQPLVAGAPVVAPAWGASVTVAPANPFATSTNNPFLTQQ